MKVKDLKGFLSKFPDDMDIVISSDNKPSDDEPCEYFEINEIYQDEPIEEPLLMIDLDRMTI